MESSMKALAGQVQVCSTEEQSEVVAPWELCLRQISSGAFEGDMQYACLGDILVYRDCWSQSGAASCALPGDYFLFGTGVKPASAIDWCGEIVNEKMLALALPNTQIDFVLPSETTYVAVMLPVHYLGTLLGDDRSQRLPAKVYHHPCHPEHGRRLIARLNGLIDHCLADPDLLEDPAQRKALEICLIDDLDEIGFGLEDALPRIGPSARRKTLSRALEYCESVRGKISVPQFAAHLAINRRTLELAFRECLGITPRQYLMYRRLHGVYEGLSRMPPGSRCITKVANSWGFTELGRFAGEYKKLFGELPGTTLNRATARPQKQLADLFF